MPFNDVPRRGLSPFWMIAIFISFSETVLGIDVIQTRGSIQIALTIFAISFPTIVCTLFFLILWKRPQVLYTPSEFEGKVGVDDYARAMHYTPTASISEEAISSIEKRLGSLLDGQLTGVDDSKEKAALILKETADAVRKSVVQIDSRSFFGKDGKVWEEPFRPTKQMDELLNALFFEMRSLSLPIFSYGKIWALKDTATERVFVPAGSQWADLNGEECDSRSLSEVGIEGGMKLEVIRLSRPD